MHRDAASCARSIKLLNGLRIHDLKITAQYYDDAEAERVTNLLDKRFFANAEEMGKVEVELQMTVREYARRRRAKDQKLDQAKQGGKKESDAEKRPEEQKQEEKQTEAEDITRPDQGNALQKLLGGGSGSACKGFKKMKTAKQWEDGQAPRDAEQQRPAPVGAAAGEEKNPAAGSDLLGALKRAGLMQHWEKLCAEDVDADAALLMSPAQFVELGMPEEDATRLLRTLKHEDEPAAAALRTSCGPPQQTQPDQSQVHGGQPEGAFKYQPADHAARMQQARHELGLAAVPPLFALSQVNMETQPADSRSAEPAATRLLRTPKPAQTPAKPAAAAPRTSSGPPQQQTQQTQAVVDLTISDEEPDADATPPFSPSHRTPAADSQGSPAQSRTPSPRRLQKKISPSRDPRVRPTTAKAAASTYAGFAAESPGRTDSVNVDELPDEPHCFRIYVSMNSHMNRSRKVSARAFAFVLP